MAEAAAPKVEIGPVNDGLTGYYHVDGKWYSEARLVEFARDHPVFECPLAALNISGARWHDADLHDLVWHVARVNKADLSLPILLDWKGRIADGTHRVIHAMVLGRRTILAKRLMWEPEPDRKDDKDDA